MSFDICRDREYAESAKTGGFLGDGVPLDLKQTPYFFTGNLIMPGRGVYEEGSVEAGYPGDAMYKIKKIALEAHKKEGCGVRYDIASAPREQFPREVFGAVSIEEDGTVKQYVLSTVRRSFDGHRRVIRS